MVSILAIIDVGLPLPPLYSPRFEQIDVTTRTTLHYSLLLLMMAVPNGANRVEWCGGGWAEQQQQRTITIDHWEQWTPCWIDGLWIRKIANLNFIPHFFHILPPSVLPPPSSSSTNDMPSSCTFESRTTEAAVENRYCGPPPPQLGMILNGERGPTDQPTVSWSNRLSPLHVVVQDRIFVVLHDL